MENELPALEDECFFIAPIGSDGSPERKRSDGVLEFIVARAAQEVGLTAVRADKLAEPGQITLQVIEHVLGSRAAVVDLTGLNPNVFYELAIRHTARLPVALIADKECKLPFDIAQMRTIFFDHTDLQSADHCRQSIAAHLREALDGAVDSPIATTIDVRTLQTGSLVERNIAELVTTVEDVAKSQRDTMEIIMRLRHESVHSDVSNDAVRDLVITAEQVARLAEEVGYPPLVKAMQDMHDHIRYLSRRTDGSRRFDSDTARRSVEPFTIVDMR